MLVRAASVSLLAAAAAVLTGCVSEHDHGKNKDVDIHIPFASMHVKTSPDAAAAGIGLTVYPGATPTKDNDKDNSAADINMSFGDFHLGVKAASYLTPDAPAKVEAFYRNDMKRYGDVIKCQGNTTIGTPARTAEGLTCADNDNEGGNGVHGHVSNSDNNTPELRAGSPQHQHIVGIEPKDGGTKIGLVMLDLPKSHNHSGAAE